MYPPTITKKGPTFWYATMTIVPLSSSFSQTQSTQSCFGADIKNSIVLSNNLAKKIPLYFFWSVPCLDWVVSISFAMRHLSKFEGWLPIAFVSPSPFLKRNGVNEDKGTYLFRLASVVRLYPQCPHLLASFSPVNIFVASFLRDKKGRS